MAGIERDNPALKGVLPKDYARPALDKQRLGQLIDLVSNIRIGDISIYGQESNYTTWRPLASPASCSPTARCRPTSRARARFARTSSRRTSWTAWWRCRVSSFTRRRSPRACGSSRATGRTASQFEPSRAFGKARVGSGAVSTCIWQMRQQYLARAISCTTAISMRGAWRAEKKA